MVLDVKMATHLFPFLPMDLGEYFQRHSSTAPEQGGVATSAGKRAEGTGVVGNPLEEKMQMFCNGVISEMVNLSKFQQRLGNSSLGDLFAKKVEAFSSGVVNEIFRSRTFEQFINDDGAIEELRKFLLEMFSETHPELIDGMTLEFKVSRSSKA